MPEGKLPPDFALVVAPTVIIFLGIFTSPWWYNAAFGQSAYRPEPRVEASAGSECVMSKAQIRVEHMSLLDGWRDQVVREGVRMRNKALVRGQLEDVEVTAGARHMEKSLTNTCLGCHTDRTTFCDVCHEYAGEAPYCWDCHVESGNAPQPRTEEGGEGRASQGGER